MYVCKEHLNECCGLAKPTSDSTATYPLQICINKNSSTFVDPNDPSKKYTAACLNVGYWTVLGDKEINDMIFDNWKRWTETPLT